MITPSLKSKISLAFAGWAAVLACYLLVWACAARFLIGTPGFPFSIPLEYARFFWESADSELAACYYIGFPLVYWGICRTMIFFAFKNRKFALFLLNGGWRFILLFILGCLCSVGAFFFFDTWDLAFGLAKMGLSPLVFICVWLFCGMLGRGALNACRKERSRVAGEMPGEISMSRLLWGLPLVWVGGCAIDSIPYMIRGMGWSWNVHTFFSFFRAAPHILFALYALACLCMWSRKEMVSWKQPYFTTMGVFVLSMTALALCEALRYGDSPLLWLPMAVPIAAVFAFYALMFRRLERVRFDLPCAEGYATRWRPFLRRAYGLTPWIFPLLILCGLAWDKLWQLIFLLRG